MYSLIDASNSIGNFILDVLSPVPEDLVVLGVGVMVVWIWCQNLRACLLNNRRQRLVSECPECKEETVTGTKEY